MAISRWDDKEFVNKYHREYQRKLRLKKGKKERKGLEYISKFCQECKQEYKIYIHDPKVNTTKFCSRNCYFSWKNKFGDGKTKHFGNGYVLIRMSIHPLANKRGFIYEHRLVMENKIGRYLTRGEVVHHINGIKTDNRPENLELFGSTGEHTTFHLLRGDLR